MIAPRLTRRSFSWEEKSHPKKKPTKKTSPPKMHFFTAFYSLGFFSDISAKNMLSKLDSHLISSAIILNLKWLHHWQRVMKTAPFTYMHWCYWKIHGLLIFCTFWKQFAAMYYCTHTCICCKTAKEELGSFIFALNDYLCGLLS